MRLRCPHCLRTFTSKVHATIGAKGGIARAAALTPERRAEIAKKAAKVRWSHREPSESAGVSVKR